MTPPGPVDRRAIAAEVEALGIAAGAEEIELEELTHNTASQITEGVWIVRAGSFEAVLKVVVNRPGEPSVWAPSEVPTDWNYWRREADAYASGLTDVFEPAGVRGPRLLQVVDRAEDAVAIWMQHETGRSGYGVTEDDIAGLSRRLGEGQGRWWESAPELPPWASHRFLRGYTASKPVDWGLLHDDAVWAHPLVAGCFPAGLREGAIALHEDWDWLLTVMEQLPRTLAHLDVWPNNLIVTDDGDHVLADWSFVGDGTFGEDIGNLVPDAVFDRFVPAAHLPRLSDRCFEQYLAGLVAGGWEGDERQVQLGYWASAVKYVWLLPLMLSKRDEEQLDYGGGAPVDPRERFRERGETLLELTRWAERARQLLRDHPDLLPDLPRR